MLRVPYALGQHAISTRRPGRPSPPPPPMRGRRTIFGTWVVNDTTAMRRRSSSSAEPCAGARSTAIGRGSRSGTKAATSASPPTSATCSAKCSPVTCSCPTRRGRSRASQAGPRLGLCRLSGQGCRHHERLPDVLYCQPYLRHGVTRYAVSPDAFAAGRVQWFTE